MSPKKSGRRVRAPVQVYLDPVDRELLEEVVRTTGLSRAEILRRGLRRVADDALTERAPGWSLERLVGVMSGAAGLPRDLAQRHDEYLYGSQEARVKYIDWHQRAVGAGESLRSVSRLRGGHRAVESGSRLVGTVLILAESQAHTLYLMSPALMRARSATGDCP